MNKIILVSMMLSIMNSTVAAQRCELDVNLTTPSSRFTVNDDGTVTDLWSQRIWKRCPLGWDIDDRGTSNHIDDVCVAGSNNIFNITDALAGVGTLNTDNFAGSNQWRMANIKELQSITERACVEPAVNLTVFPGLASNIVVSANISAGRPINYSFVKGDDSFGGSVNEIDSVTGLVLLLRN